MDNLTQKLSPSGNRTGGLRVLNFSVEYKNMFIGVVNIFSLVSPHYLCLSLGLGLPAPIEREFL